MKKSAAKKQHSIRVQDLMTEEVSSLTPQDTLTAAYDLMDELKVRHIPILDSDGELVGLLSHRDLLRGALFATRDLTVSQVRDMLKNIKIEEVMSTEVETVTPNEDISEAGKIMLENKYGCLPVVEKSSIVGILTESDFIRYVVNME